MLTIFLYHAPPNYILRECLLIWTVFYFRILCFFYLWVVVVLQIKKLNISLLDARLIICIYDKVFQRTFFGIDAFNRIYFYVLLSMFLKAIFSLEYLSLFSNLEKTVNIVFWLKFVCIYKYRSLVYHHVVPQYILEMNLRPKNNTINI